MIVQPIYLLDANVFIQAQRQWYPFDIAPAFWEALVQQGASGRVISIDRVKDEIDRVDDRVAAWARREFRNWFVPTTGADVIASYRQIMEWVMAQAQFFDEAKAEFAGQADGWLVAYARARGHVVVTHEQLKPDARKRVPLPNVCEPFGVKYINTFVMLRGLGISFRLP